MVHKRRVNLPGGPVRLNLYRLTDLRDGSNWVMVGRSYTEVWEELSTEQVNPITLYPTLPNLLRIVDIKRVME